MFYEWTQYFAGHKRYMLFLSTYVSFLPSTQKQPKKSPPDLNFDKSRESSSMEKINSFHLPVELKQYFIFAPGFLDLLQNFYDAASRELDFLLTP